MNSTFFQKYLARFEPFLCWGFLISLLNIMTTAFFILNCTFRAPGDSG